MSHRKNGITGDLGAFPRMLARAASRVFRRREVLLRSGGSVVYLPLPVIAQFALLLVAGATVGWLGYATHAYLSYDRIASENRELHRTMAALRGEFSDVAGSLVRKRADLETLVSQNVELHQELGQLRTHLSQVENARGSGEKHRIALRRQVEALEGRLAAAEKRNASLKGSLETTRSALAQLRTENVATETARDGLRTRVAGLERRLSALRESQASLVGRAAERTSQDMERVEHIIAQTGLNAAKLLARVDKRGRSAVAAAEDAGDKDAGGSPESSQGGPFVPAKDGLPAARGAQRDAAPVEVAIRSYDRQLARWEEMQRLLRSLPLVAPLDHYKLSSGHGRRKDPLNGRMAMHEGVDLTSDPRAHAHATAAGTVVLAGWSGQYGRTVEIDHGYGIRTRYAHLQRITVRRGQHVSFWQSVGQIGNSGRSTGIHLHYEVLVNGKSLDPERFMRAGKNVFKG